MQLPHWPILNLIQNEYLMNFLKCENEHQKEKENHWISKWWMSSYINNNDNWLWAMFKSNKERKKKKKKGKQLEPSCLFNHAIMFNYHYYVLKDMWFLNLPSITIVKNLDCGFPFISVSHL